MLIQLIKPYKRRSGRTVEPGTQMEVTPELGTQLITNGIARKIIKKSFLDALRAINDARINEEEE